MVLSAVTSRPIAATSLQGRVTVHIKSQVAAPTVWPTATLRAVAAANGAGSRRVAVEKPTIQSAMPPTNASSCHLSSTRPTGLASLTCVRAPFQYSGSCPASVNVASSRQNSTAGPHSHTRRFMDWPSTLVRQQGPQPGRVQRQIAPRRIEITACQHLRVTDDLFHRARVALQLPRGGAAEHVRGDDGQSDTVEHGAA